MRSLTRTNWGGFQYSTTTNPAGKRDHPCDGVQSRRSKWSWLFASMSLAPQKVRTWFGFFLIMTIEHVAFACQGHLADSMADASSVVFLPWKKTKRTRSCLHFLAGVSL